MIEAVRAITGGALVILAAVLVNEDKPARVATLVVGLVLLDAVRVIVPRRPGGS